jgi:hypothetical protein
MSIESRLASLEKSAAGSIPAIRRRDDDIRVALDVCQMDYSFFRPPELLAKMDRLQEAIDSGDRSGLLPDDLDIQAAVERHQHSA